MIEPKLSATAIHAVLASAFLFQLGVGLGFARPEQNPPDSPGSFQSSSVAKKSGFLPLGDPGDGLEGDPGDGLEGDPGDGTVVWTCEHFTFGIQGTWAFVQFPSDIPGTFTRMAEGNR